MYVNVYVHVGVCVHVGGCGCESVGFKGHRKIQLKIDVRNSQCYKTFGIVDNAISFVRD